MLGSIIGAALGAVLNFIARLWNDKAAREAERDAGAEKQRADSQAKRIEDEKAAASAREDVRRDLARNPDSRMQDDGFSRD